jgi:hypothetical protein
MVEKGALEMGKSQIEIKRTAVERIMLPYESERETAVK